MLVNKSLKNGDVACIRLNGGEEVVGKIVNTNDTVVTLAKPRLLRMTMNRDGAVGASFLPFLISSNDDENCQIFTNSMVTMPMTVNKDVQNEYLGITSSIEIPKKGLII